MFCTECGKEISQDFKFCPHCGFNLKQALSTIVIYPSTQKETSSNNSDVINLAKQFGTIETKPNIYQNAKLRLREMGRERSFTPVREYFFKETPKSLLRKIDIVWKSPEGFAAAFNIKSKNCRLEFVDDLEQVNRLKSFKADKKYIVNVSKSSGKAFFIEITEDLVKTIESDVSDSSIDSTSIVEQKAYNVDIIREKYSRAYEKWTTEEDKQIIDEFSKGLTVLEIAEKHGRQKGAISSRLNKLINNDKDSENIKTNINTNEKDNVPLAGQFTFLVKSEKNVGICLACIDETKKWVRPITAGGFKEEDLVMDNGKQLEVFDIVETKFDYRFPILHHKENVVFTVGSPLHYVRTMTESEREDLLAEISNVNLFNNVISKENLFDELTNNLGASIALVGPASSLIIQYKIGDHHPRIWFANEEKQTFSLSCTDLKFCKFIRSKFDGNPLSAGIISSKEIDELKDKQIYLVVGLTGDSLDANNNIKDGKWHGKYWPLIVGVLTLPDYSPKEWTI